MKLVDDVIITVKAGNGGNGATVIKQLYATKKTAPDGGNGGNGGSIYFKADRNISDLSQFQFKKKINGNNGIDGGRKDKDGANGEDITVLVPYGTTIKNTTTGEYVELLTDLPFCVAKGGDGGMGNHDYHPLGMAGSSHKPGKFGSRRIEGTQGDEYELHLILNLIADVGLVGLPNAGKSSILKTLTNAEPKIGNYAFTTLSPNLGVIGNKVMADIPGLISGASEGKGLGISFLKHIKKTTALLHCIDVTQKDPYEAYLTVRKEFEEFDKSLLAKEEIIVLTKVDLVDEKTIEYVKKELKPSGRKITVFSIYDEDSYKDLKELILNIG